MDVRLLIQWHVIYGGKTVNMLPMRRYLITILLMLLCYLASSQVGETGKIYTWNQFIKDKDVIWTPQSNGYVVTVINNYIDTNTFINGLADSLYISYGCLASPGWKYSGDTIYVDTCASGGSGSTDSIYVSYGCFLGTDSWLLNGDTLFI